ncbi:hypothetical protein AB1K62_03480 [Parasphingorhabdus sp. JC815]|uniref:hypothetical protein n=1 Tax=Parasphingorhabdus sp. JC815 TaxID=3232140 RepID=UPI0034593ECF
MSEPKPLASLSSSLLARKGGAKPAMRRQGMAFPAYSDDENEDLGWNDMGYDTNPDHDMPHSGMQGSEDTGQYQYNPLAGAIPEVVPAVRKQQEEIAAKLSLQPPRDNQTTAENEKTAASTEEELHPVDPQQAAPVLRSIPKEVPSVGESPISAENASTGDVLVPRKKVTKTKPSAKIRRPAQKSRTRKAKIAFTLRLDAERHLKLRLATAVENSSAQQLVTRALDEYLKTIPELDGLAERIPSRGKV